MREAHSKRLLQQDIDEKRAKGESFDKLVL
jgi:hypothetical protein